ncbi:hypothetical protein [Halovenus marina]|uniref:hypothetical protein n=1 Tax=Halovenus marina TaxID=3396621 RepID=UPI003F566D0C
MTDGSGPNGSATADPSVDPKAAGASGERSEQRTANDDSKSSQRGPESGQQAVPPRQWPPRESLDWRGWVLVGVVVLSVLVIPLFVLYLPEAHWLLGRMGFSLRQAYLIFPMIPALLLGAVAVWSAVRSRPPGQA